MSDRKRVWILGAGFSRPLGAPLLHDLFSANMREEITARFGERADFLKSDCAKHVYRVFRSKRMAWKHAEDFIDFLDAAAVPESPQSRRMANAYPGVPLTCSDIRDVACRIVAAECSAFLEGNPVTIESHQGKAETTERWLPYETWGQHLQANDTIISFNYDRLLENLRAALPRPHFFVAESARSLEGPGARVLKLHGSVDWILAADGQSFVVRPNYPWLKEGSMRLAIGTPGPTKLNTSLGALSWLWDAARAAIREANEIFLVGYRFPETDAYARREILEALRDSSVTTVRAILGSGSTHSQRIGHMIGLTKSGVRFKIEDMGAEDFLSCWRPE